MVLTTSYGIIYVQHCLAQPSVRHGDGPLALVLAPTRELAQQIEKEVKFDIFCPTWIFLTVTEYEITNNRIKSCNL